MRTKVLWLSRHIMTDEQLSDLKRIYGDDVEITTFTESVKSALDVVKIGEHCDVLAVVLPPTIIADLTSPRINTKPVIRAVANRVETGNMIVNPATGRDEKEFKFEHDHWEKVIRVIVETERL